MGVNDARETDPAALVATPDPRDARIVSCGLERQSVSTTAAATGRQALERLAADGDSSFQLVVLDLAVEAVDALTVLDAIRSSPRLGQVPVVVLTTPDGDGVDAARAHELGANAHVRPADDPDTYADRIARLATFWFEWVTFPPEYLYPDREII